MYAADGFEQVFKIDISDGTVSLVGTHNIVTPVGISIAFDQIGQMYATTAVDNSALLEFYTMDKTNAQATLVADFTSAGVGNHGLGAAPLPHGDGDGDGDGGHGDDDDSDDDDDDDDDD